MCSAIQIDQRMTMPMAMAMCSLITLGRNGAVS